MGHHKWSTLTRVRERIKEGWHPYVTHDKGTVWARNRGWKTETEEMTFDEEAVLDNVLDHYCICSKHQDHNRCGTDSYPCPCLRRTEEGEVYCGHRTPVPGCLGCKGGDDAASDPDPSA